MKRFLIVTQYFYPENFKSNDMAFELQKRGYDVDVLTSIPNYPTGKYFAGYGLLRHRVETIHGVKVYRAFQTPRGKKARGVFLALNYLTFAICSCFWLIRLVLKKYDAIIVHEPSPITQALPAVLLSKWKKIPLYIWVLDIWPDAMKSGGGIKNELIIKAISLFVQWVYNQSTKILISSRGFKNLIIEQGDYEDKIVYFPNWADDITNMQMLPIPSLKEGFKIMMAGNLGSAQTIKEVMAAVFIMKNNKSVKWLFVGDGSERSYIDDFVKKYNLEETVSVLGRYPSEYMPAFYKQADAMLLTLRAKYPHLKAVVPARLQSYMAAGKPIIGMIDGESAKLINEVNCGCCVPAEDYKSLCDMIKEKILPNIEGFKSLGKNGRLYYEHNFTKDSCIDNLEQIIWQTLRN